MTLVEQPLQSAQESLPSPAIMTTTVQLGDLCITKKEQIKGHAFSSDESFVVMVDAGGTIRLYKKEGDKYIQEPHALRTHSLGVTVLAVPSDGSHVAYVDCYGKLQIMDVTFGFWSPVEVRLPSQASRIVRLQWCDDDETLLCYEEDRVYRLKQRVTYWKQRPYWSVVSQA